jgi:FKBP-type peptidyl-prolyl cis-trans isomerase FklB
MLQNQKKSQNQNKKMKKILLSAALISLVQISQAQLNNKLDSVSYLIGTNIGSNLLRQIPEINKELLFKGLSDLLDGKAPICSDQGQVNAYFQEKTEKEGAVTKADGLKFLEENKKNPKVKITASGLQYEVMKMGTGQKPLATSKVKVHYHGTTPDGRVFDSSVDRGQPASFPLNGVIKGWIEGLQLMPVGSKFKFYIPQELAYGANPQPGSIIKPYMPLVFEVELLSIEK